jgi:hypothetical protein
MSKPLFQRLGLLAATAITAVTLVACGGDSSAPAKVVATSDLGITIDAASTNKAAILSTLTKAPYTFNNNITLKGVTYLQPVKITVSGSDVASMTFALEDSTAPTKQTATGPLKLGSCVFTVGPGVGPGNDTTFTPCTFSVLLKSKTFTPGEDTVVNYYWSLDGTIQSLAGTFTVRVASNGDVTAVFGTTLYPIGNVPVTAATGATGGTGT